VARLDARLRLMEPDARRAAKGRPALVQASRLMWAQGAPVDPWALALDAARLPGRAGDKAPAIARAKALARRLAAGRSPKDGWPADLRDPAPGAHGVVRAAALEQALRTSWGVGRRGGARGDAVCREGAQRGRGERRRALRAFCPRAAASAAPTAAARLEAFLAARRARADVAGAAMKRPTPPASWRRSPRGPPLVAWKRRRRWTCPKAPRAGRPTASRRRASTGRGAVPGQGRARAGDAGPRERLR
jgi:hypothetical protein